MTAAAEVVGSLHLVVGQYVQLWGNGCTHYLLTIHAYPKIAFHEQKSPKSGTQHNFQEHINKLIPTFMK